MPQRLPPLNALRAFEAAGRHLSITKAAEELHVTPAAVSHQVKALEDYLGQPLFRRLNRQLLLTDAGQLCLPGVRDGFERLAEAMARLDERKGNSVLAVSVAPSFAAKWLVPRLERFTRAHPNLDVRISPSMELSDFRGDQIDIAVRFGFGDYSGLVVDKLIDESVVPLCSPALMAGEHPLETPDDLRHHSLLHDESIQFDSTTPDWAMWLKAAGVSGVDASRGAHFSYADHAIQAAINGAGVVLGRHSLAAADIAAGHLVMPFALCLPLAPAYYVVLPEAALERSNVAAFRDWLLAEARAEREANKPEGGACGDPKADRGAR